MSALEEMTASRDAWRAEAEQLRDKLRILLIDPSPLTPTQLASLRRLLNTDGSE